MRESITIGEKVFSVNLVAYRRKHDFDTVEHRFYEIVREVPPNDRYDISDEEGKILFFNLTEQQATTIMELFHDFSNEVDFLLEHSEK